MTNTELQSSSSIQKKRKTSDEREMESRRPQETQQDLRQSTSGGLFPPFLLGSLLFSFCRFLCGSLHLGSRYTPHTFVPPAGKGAPSPVGVKMVGTVAAGRNQRRLCQGREVAGSLWSCLASSPHHWPSPPFPSHPERRPCLQAEAWGAESIAQGAALA